VDIGATVLVRSLEAGATMRALFATSIINNTCCRHPFTKGYVSDMSELVRTGMVPMLRHESARCRHTGAHLIETLSSNAGDATRTRLLAADADLVPALTDIVRRLPMEDEDRTNKTAAQRATRALHRLARCSRGQDVVKADTVNAVIGMLEQEQLLLHAETLQALALLLLQLTSKRHDRALIVALPGARAALERTAACLEAHSPTDACVQNAIHCIGVAMRRMYGRSETQA
jgi:hypothetical protein